MSETGFGLDQICYAGDGKYDIQIMKLVKFAACPSNAISDVREIANIHLKRMGGDGCVWCWCLMHIVLLFSGRSLNQIQII